MSRSATLASPDLQTTQHPSLRPARVAGRRRRRFEAPGASPTPAPDARISPRDARPRRGLVDVAVAAADSAGPLGGLVAEGISALTGASADPREEQMDAMWEMQRDSQSFNLEYLALQSSMQDENRRFTAMSNLMKAQHDTTKAAISNIRV